VLGSSFIAAGDDLERRREALEVVPGRPDEGHGPAGAVRDESEDVELRRRVLRERLVEGELLGGERRLDHRTHGSRCPNSNTQAIIYVCVKFAA
jgi:hypothetical protein